MIRLKPITRSPLARGAAAWVILFFFFTICQFPFRHVPYFWDAIGYVLPHAQEIHEADLFPILRNWDVGHPTGFIWPLAAMMKLVGVGPLAGHLLTWAFAALMLVAFYGNGRLLGLPRTIAATGAMAFLAFPMVWAGTLQMELDLPLTAMILAAVWFWGRGRRWGYFLIGGYAALIKLYGVLFVIPLAGTILLTSGAFWRTKRTLASFARDFLWTLSPIFLFGVFLIARFAVRGGGLTIDWTTGNQPIPLWRIEEWLHYAPLAWAMLFECNLLQWVLFAAAAAWWGVGLACLRRERPVNITRANLRRPLAHVLVILAFGGLFMQLESLLPRYALPIAASSFLLLTQGLWKLCRRSWAAMAAHVAMSILFVILWHPRHAQNLPAPLNDWLKRPAWDEAWFLEADLRFLDVVEAIQWSAAAVRDDAESSGRPATVTARWPIWVALWHPPYGYVPQRMVSAPAEAWSDVDWETTAYAIQIDPIGFGGDPAEGSEAELVSEMHWGDIWARVWRKRL